MHDGADALGGFVMSDREVLVAGDVGNDGVADRGGVVEGGEIDNADENSGEAGGAASGGRASEGADGGDGGGEGSGLSLRSSLEQVEARLARAELLLTAQRLLADAGAVDVESGAVLIERALVGGGVCDEAAVAEAVKALKRRKPRLFAASGGGGGGGGGGGLWGRGGGSAGAWEDEGDSAERRLAALADRASRSGDRRSVMRYLRERRSVS